MAGKQGQEGTVLKRKELMMSLLRYICYQVQVMKMVIPLKEESQKKTVMIPLMKIQEKTTPHAQSVALGIVIAWRNGSVVMGVSCGSTKSVQT